jgi:two-component system, OmpR family, sensor histidine kinase KdpD
VVACFVVAAVSLAVGFVLTTGWLLNAQLHPILHGIGLILLIIGIPMIILGGHCMDLQDKKISNRNIKAIIAILETHGRAETATLAEGLERVPMRQLDYRGVTLEEMDIDAVIARDPQVAIVDELAHTDVPGSKNRKRYKDVLELLNHGISVITAVNIQHIESLNDVVARTTGVRVRETVPDYSSAAQKKS